MSIDNSQSGGIAAGWYADPASAERMRYWDGNGWTDRTAPLTVPAAEPAAPVASAPVTPTAPAAPAVVPPPSDATAVMAPTSVAAPAASASSPVAGSPAAAEFGGGFVPETPGSEPGAAATVLPAAAAVTAVTPPTPAAPTPAAPAPTAPVTPSAPATPAPVAPVAAAPVVVSTGEARPVDADLARSARRVAAVFNILALIVLVVGLLFAVVAALAGFGLFGTNESGAVPSQISTEPIGGIITALAIAAYTAVVWALWKLLSIVARYIALRAE